MNIFKRNIREDHITRKDFSYEKNAIKLAFKLRIDVKLELKTFKDLLEKAIEDIDYELEKMD